jgi:hypothetical protein
LKLLDDDHLRDLFLFHLLVLVILLIVDRIIDASDGHPVVNTSLINAGGQGVLRHREVSGSDQGLSGIVVLSASVTEELPDLLRAGGSSLPEFNSPLFKAVLGEGGLIAGCALDALTSSLIWKNLFNIRVL